MSEHRRLLRALWESTAPLWSSEKSPKKPDTAALLQNAKREMEEIHAKNRERAIQAITQKNNLQQMVDDLEHKVKRLSDKAQAMEAFEEWEQVSQLRREQSRYEESLATTRESLRKAVEVSELVKAHIQNEQEAIRKKTSELLAMESEWKASAIQEDIEQQLHSKVHRLFDENYTLYPLKAVRDLLGISLGVIIVLLSIVLILVFY